MIADDDQPDERGFTLDDRRPAARSLVEGVRLLNDHVGCAAYGHGLDRLHAALTEDQRVALARGIDGAIYALQTAQAELSGDGYDAAPVSDENDLGIPF